MKFLVFATDLPPIEGYPTSGTALRTWNIAEGLRDLGHEVVVSSPSDAVDGFLKKNPSVNAEFLKDLDANSFNASNQSSLVANHHPDAIICGHWPAWTTGRKPAQPLILDLAGPHLLERHYQGDENKEGGIVGKLSALSCADYFIVSGLKQKLYFLSFLLRAKIENPETRICTIPMPLPPNENWSKDSSQADLSNSSNPAANEFNPKFIFGGIFLPWQNPTWGLRFLSGKLKEKQNGHLTLIGGAHPHYPIDSNVYQSLFSELESNPHVTRKPLMPYDKFQEEMSNKDIAIDLMDWNLERELAITIRSCTYLWSGIPVIYNNYSDLSKLIAKHDAGWCVEPGDEDALNKIINQIFQTPEILRQKKNGAINLAKENFNRTQHAQSILDLLNRPSTRKAVAKDISIDSGDNCNIPIDRNSTLTQTFVSRISGLNEVRFLIGTHGKVSENSLRVCVNETDTDRTIKEITFAKEDLSDNTWLKVQFTPEFESAGKKYSLKLESDSTKENAVISPWTISHSPYPLTGLFLNDKKLGNYSLCLQTSSASS